MKTYKQYIEKKTAGGTKKVGLILYAIDKKTVKIGWSLCNTKPLGMRVKSTDKGKIFTPIGGDVFSEDMAEALARGRALSEEAHNFSADVSQAPAVGQLIKAGIPHSVVTNFRNELPKIIKDNKVEKVVIFNSKPPKESTDLAW